MSVAVAHELKGLQTQRNKLRGEIAATGAQIGTLTKQMAASQKHLSGIEKAISKIENDNREFVVTEHALLRFLERVDGIDMEQLKTRVLPDGARALAEAMGSGTFPAGTHRVVIKAKSVVSVLEAE